MKQIRYQKHFYALVVIAAFLVTSIRFVTVNAAVVLQNSSNSQEKILPPGITDGVYDGVLMKMTDIAYSDLSLYVGDSLGSIAEIVKDPSGISNQINTVNQLYWHLPYSQASQLFFSDLNNWKIIDVQDAEPIYGFYAIAFEQGNTIVIAYRGTDDIQDVMSDADIYLNIQGEIKQLQLAEQFASDVRKSLPNSSYHVIFTGHSIGGWLAQQMYLNELQKAPHAPWQSVHATVFDSIGTEFRPSATYNLAVKDYHFQGDIFSHFGTTLGKKIGVPNPMPNESIYDKHQLYNFYGYFYS